VAFESVVDHIQIEIIFHRVTNIVQFAPDEYNAIENLLKTNAEGTKRAVFQPMGIYMEVSPSYEVLKERVAYDYYGLQLPVNHFIFDALNLKISQLVESGIMDKIAEKYKPEVKPTDPSDPTVLTLDQLLIWFELWFLFLLIATVFFLLEFLLRKLQDSFGKK
jgi:hypothetical protein